MPTAFLTLPKTGYALYAIQRLGSGDELGEA